MSVFSAKTGLSSILKSYSPMERDKAKHAIINKVRFEMPKRRGLLEAVEAVCEEDNYQAMNEFVEFLRDGTVNDIEFFRILTDARIVVHKMSPKFTNLVEALLALPWTKRTPEAMQAYAEFCVDVMVAHSKYIDFGIPKLIENWVPGDADASAWPNGTPDDTKRTEMQVIHKLLDRILSAVPMTFDVLLQSIKLTFPYFKKPTHVVAGFLHNVLWLIEYKPIFTEAVLQLVMKRMILLDVNAPRSEIEEAEDEEEDEMDDAEQEIFEMDDCNKEPAEVTPMNHPIAQTLDICMEKLYSFLDTRNPTSLNLSEEQKLQRQTHASNFLKVLLKTFDNVILPSHNTHHVQFLLFYYCSFKHTISEAFVTSLWDKVKNPNVSAIVRQNAVGYVASFLARSKFVPIATLKHYLKELCNWAHQYIQSSDQYRSSGSLKANLVFFSVCQSIFYVVAFRSRDLTVDKKDLLYLQTLQLSALVTSNFNPLRVCLPAVATAFAGVTRVHQLAYCHAILERNARRKLATVYANDTATPQETLDTFFPFDPYLLKISLRRIAPHYLQYQASEAEAQTTGRSMAQLRRKRGDSEMVDDVDVDDFIIADKRQKYADLARSQEREAQFTYGLSPGFHM